MAVWGDIADIVRREVAALKALGRLQDEDIKRLGELARIAKAIPVLTETPPVETEEVTADDVAEFIKSTE